MRDYWVLVHKDSGSVVLPYDCNPGSGDEGMLVYRSKKAADMACEHQNDLYEIDCVAIPLTELKD